MWIGEIQSELHILAESDKKDKKNISGPPTQGADLAGSFPGSEIQTN